MKPIVKVAVAAESSERNASQSRNIGVMAVDDSSFVSFASASFIIGLHTIEPMTETI